MHRCNCRLKEKALPERAFALSEAPGSRGRRGELRRFGSADQ